LVELINSTDGFELTGEYTNGEEAMSILKNPPDIVIIDIMLPGINGVELISRIKNQNDSIQFLVCSGYDDNETVFAALESGAVGFILKDYTSDQIIEAIRDLYKGGSPMSPFIARKVISSFQKKKIDGDGTLTERERQIIHQASLGKQYKEIAKALDIGHETVKKHMKNIYQKLHVQNKIEAINKYRQNN
jgi:two-component system, NarL family, response regulator LiaR